MEKMPQNSSDRKYYLFAMKIVGDFGASIAIPAVLGAVAGNWLDEKYARSPFFTILCLALAFLATARIIQKKAKKYGELYQKM